MWSKVVLFVFACALCGVALSESFLGTTDNSDLVKALNAALKALRSSGDLTALATKWSVDLPDPKACQDYSWPSSPSGSLYAVLATQTLRFCHDPEPNLPYWDVPNQGFEQDLAVQLTNQIAKHYRVSLNFTWADVTISSNGFFGSLLIALENNLCDAALSNIGITSARQAQAYSSCPYATFQEGYLRGPLDPALNLSTISQLNAPSVKVGIIPGTIYQTVAEQNLTNAQIIPVADIETGEALVANGTIHVFMFDVPVLQYWLSQNSNKCSSCVTIAYGRATDSGLYVAKRFADFRMESGGAILMYECVLVLVAVVLAMLL